MAGATGAGGGIIAQLARIGGCRVVATAGGADPVLLVQSGSSFGLVVPGDRTGARDVHDVAHITVH